MQAVYAGRTVRPGMSAECRLLLCGRNELRQSTLHVVSEQVQRTVWSLAHVSDALALGLTKRLGSTR